MSSWTRWASMAIDAISVCDTSSTATSQNLAFILSIVFAGYLLVDSVLASYVILRKSVDVDVRVAA
ncbi:MAG: hypothetical protein VW984_08225 [Halieaceae bacterium]